MECIFMNPAGQTLFVRDDMESGHWTQQEMNVTAVFPFNPAKKIERGQRIAFRDPATHALQVFEIRVVTNHEPEHYQQITAEHICISELSDEHINSFKVTDKTAGEALTLALTGTLWSAGADLSSGTQSADFSRGSVWDVVNTIKQNWNVYITPVIMISEAGAITGRYLEITPAEGAWRGLRLSVRKNMLDPAVTYDDEDVYTALHGYGGNVDVPHQSGDDTTQEITFADVVWTATSDHPAKPAGQTFLEWPEKTALYGRNGRPRYGYYQNGSIKDANILLEKTWESLKLSCEPKISITGTIADLYRLGYKDQPLQLHDLVIVEIEETGETFQKQIICCDIDLIDPTGSRVDVGDYIPNIIYINRETDKKAGGGGGGGRGPGSMTNLEDDDVKTFAEFVKTNEKIGMVVGTRDGDNYIKGGEITLAINEDGGTTAKIQADVIDIDGLVNALTVYDITVETITTTNTATFGGDVEMPGLTITDGGDINGFTNIIGNYATLDDVTTDTLTVDSEEASWQTYTARYCNMSTGHYFLYASSSSSQTPSGSVQGYLPTSYTNTVLHYLGYPDS